VLFINENVTGYKLIDLKVNKVHRNSIQIIKNNQHNLLYGDADCLKSLFTS